jgi:hypothetical protein
MWALDYDSLDSNPCSVIDYLCDREEFNLLEHRFPHLRNQNYNSISQSSYLQTIEAYSSSINRKAIY